MKKKILSLIILLALLGISSQVFALETAWPPSPLDPSFTLTNDSTLTDMVRYFYEWGIFLGGLAVLIALLFGGFLYLTSAGNPERMREAKDRIFSALIGLVLLLSIFIILNTINPELTILTPPSFVSPFVSFDVSALYEKSKEKSCQYVRFYDKPNYESGRPSKKVDASPDPLMEYIHNDWAEPKSVRFFQKCDSPVLAKSDSELVTTSEVCIDGKLNIKISKRRDSNIVTTSSPTGVVCELEKGPTRLDGDVNGDCVVDLEDVGLCIAGDLRCDWTDGYEGPPDGIVNLFDMVVVTSNIGNTCDCYKEGGCCSVDFYIRSGYWPWEINLCGEKAGNTNNSLHNIKAAIQIDATIECAKVTQTGVKE